MIKLQWIVDELFRIIDGLMKILQSPIQGHLLASITYNNSNILK